MLRFQISHFPWLHSLRYFKDLRYRYYDASNLLARGKAQENVYFRKKESEEFELFKRKLALLDKEMELRHTTKQTQQCLERNPEMAGETLIES